MNTNTFRVRACFNQTIPHDWREHLVGLLGSRPRRLSGWCELGLLGALSCLKQGGLECPSGTLDSQIAINLISNIATGNSAQKALAQAREGLPMPFTFMQTQPGQLFNALGSAVNWHGNGVTTAYTQVQQGEAALLHSIKSAALIGWVDELPNLISSWIWLERAQPDADVIWQPLTSCLTISESAKWLAIDKQQCLFQAIM